MIYKCPQEMPYNISEKSANHWEKFVNLTLAGNVLGAINEYHLYSLEKQKCFIKKTKQLIDEMELWNGIKLFFYFMKCVIITLCRK